MGYQDKEKHVENPDVVSKVRDEPWFHQCVPTALCGRTANLIGSLVSYVSLNIFPFFLLLFSLVIHEGLLWLGTRVTSLYLGWLHSNRKPDHGSVMRDSPDIPMNGWLG